MSASGALVPGSGADTLHGRSRPGSSWTTTNVGEAVPGVSTPLAWSIWGPAGEAGLRGAFQAIGALSRSEAAVPPATEDRLFSLFYGRLAMHLDLLCQWADRIPGTSGEAMATQLFTYVPPEYECKPARRYYPRVLLRACIPWVQGPRGIRRSRREMEAFWHGSIELLPRLDAAGAASLLLEGAGEFADVIYRHTVLTLGAVQPVYDLLERVCEGTDVSGQELMGGHGGHEETALVRDLWECSRDRMTLEAFVARYGYHGPREGDLTTLVWREQPEPVRRLIESYRSLPEGSDPFTLERRQIERREDLERSILGSMSPAKRPLARLAMSLATRFIPLRGVGKVAFLQGLDVTRAAARRLGELQTDAGLLDEPDDVFFLTLEDLERGWPPDARALVGERRAFRDLYMTLDLPEVWQGEPAAIPVSAHPQDGRVEGIGASPGVVEGRALVVIDTAEAEVEEGDILVARHTDPAWASLMFLSAGLVSDIGGLMSHTAVVARELGIPCVVNTRSGTSAIATGDLVRLDGAAGTVEVLEARDRACDADNRLSW